MNLRVHITGILHAAGRIFIPYIVPTSLAEFGSKDLRGIMF